MLKSVIIGRYYANIGEMAYQKKDRATSIIQYRYRWNGSGQMRNEHEIQNSFKRYRICRYENYMVGVGSSGMTPPAAVVVLDLVSTKQVDSCYCYCVKHLTLLDM